ncbi:MAG TPA: hypothetical protein VEP94_04040 [Solirubrobacterales bacterium]|jgi:hypothetical protein|nr:hypothetical protein [Solirubrobacterales bacterium]
MADIETRIIEVDDMLLRPGTYFNPQTEIVVVVDDSTSIDQEIFNMEAYEGSDWVRISDEVPVDEDGLGATLEEFQTHYRAATPDTLTETAVEQADDPDEEEVEAEEPGRED